VSEYIALGFIGLIVALLSSYLGFGGGTVVVPLLPFLTGLDIKSTLATSLAVVALNAANNTYHFNQKKLIRWSLALTISCSSVLLAVFSSYYSHHISEGIVRWLVISVFIFVAVLAAMGPRVLPTALLAPKTFNYLLIGALAGLVAGFGGLGGATILVPIFLVGRWTLNEEVAPTGNAINMLTATAVSVETLLTSAHLIRWPAVGVILGTSMLVSHFARQKQSRLTETQRRSWMVLFLLLVIIIQVQRAVRA
jgi:uncharacterized membrane protein YfcA